MGAQGKRKTVSFSLSDEERGVLLANADNHGFEDRNEYLLALMEADKALRLAPVFDLAAKRVVLRPNGKIDPHPSTTSQRREEGAVLRRGKKGEGDA